VIIHQTRGATLNLQFRCKNSIIIVAVAGTKVLGIPRTWTVPLGFLRVFEISEGKRHLGERRYPYMEQVNLQIMHTGCDCYSTHCLWRAIQWRNSIITVLNIFEKRIKKMRSITILISVLL